MVILALDYGDKRIGVAIANTDNKIAFLRPYFLYNQQVYQTIAILCQKEKVDHIVVGYPLLLNGHHSVSANKVQVFTNHLAQELFNQSLLIKIELIDERLSTSMAYNKLAVHKWGIKNKKEHIDAISAQIILENYLSLL